MSDAKSIRIHSRFQGLYDTGQREPDPRGLATFIRSRGDARVRFTLGQFVIKGAGALSRFVENIPKLAMYCDPDPPPSDDPLLRRPGFDFERRMMLVVKTHNPNFFIDPEIVRVELTAETMLVHCRYAEQSPAVAKIISYGRYFAAIVDRFEGDVRFVTWNG